MLVLGEGPRFLGKSRFRDHKVVGRPCSSLSLHTRRLAAGGGALLKSGILRASSINVSQGKLGGTIVAERPNTEGRRHGLNEVGEKLRSMRLSSPNNQI